MGMNITRSVRIGTIVVLWLAFAGVSVAQQSTTAVNVRNFEVISVDGNKLVVRDQNGTQELSVPDDFRFTVDGKPMSVNELKPGMKGTATITTTTTVTPVFVTEVREADVLRVTGNSMDVREGDTVRHFTQGQLSERGIQISKDGRPVRVADLKRGDKLTATIVTQGAPTVLTQQEVQAVLAEASPSATPTQAASTMTSEPSKSPSAAPAAGAASPPTESQGPSTMWWVVIAVLVVLGLVFFARRRKST